MCDSAVARAYGAGVWHWSRAGVHGAVLHQRDFPGPRLPWIGSPERAIFQDWSTHAHRWLTSTIDEEKWLPISCCTA